jgi:hypothetical protein
MAEENGADLSDFIYLSPSYPWHKRKRNHPRITCLPNREWKNADGSPNHELLLAEMLVQNSLEVQKTLILSL